jgi:hypothetical protein
MLALKQINRDYTVARFLELFFLLRTTSPAALGSDQAMATDAVVACFKVTLLLRPGRQASNGPYERTSANRIVGNAFAKSMGYSTAFVQLDFLRVCQGTRRHQTSYLLGTQWHTGCKSTLNWPGLDVDFTLGRRTLTR